jgi:hypothetical protein
MTMTEQNDSQRGPRILIIMAAFVVIIWGIYQAQVVLVPFLVSVFLAVIGLRRSSPAETHSIGHRGIARRRESSVFS